MVRVRLRRGPLAPSLFTTIATLETPLDVTLQELRVEMLFPPDERAKRALEIRRQSYGDSSTRIPGNAVSAARQLPLLI